MRQVPCCIPSCSTDSRISYFAVELRVLRPPSRNRQRFCLRSIRKVSLLHSISACSDRYHTEVRLNTVIQRVIEKIVPDPLLKSQAPILFLAFDEAHTLSEAYYDKEIDTQWTAFTSLRRALRSTRSFPIWSLFLSTTGKSDQFAPPHLDGSGRIIRGELHNVMPYSAVGFDQVAMKGHENTTLEDVVDILFRLALGRPLYVLSCLLFVWRP